MTVCHFSTLKASCMDGRGERSGAAAAHSMGAGFRRKREPRGAGGRRNPREVAAAFLKLYPISLYDARAAEPDGIGNLVL